MGNQREIVQVEPRKCRGAALRIRIPHEATVIELVQRSQGHYYSYVVPAGSSVVIGNMDGPDTDLGVLGGRYIAIQSGGKMWCGYDAFVTHVRSLAEYVEDALFYVGDENDYIDEFQIRAGTLAYRRVHHGSWRPIEDYLTRATASSVIAED
jgi:hypothetical protein